MTFPGQDDRTALHILLSCLLVQHLNQSFVKTDNLSFSGFRAGIEDAVDKVEFRHAVHAERSPKEIEIGGILAFIR